MILSKHSSLLDAFHRCFWAIQEYFISKGFQFVVNAHDKVALMAGARAGLPRKRKRVQTTHVGSLPRPDWLLPILRGEERPPPDYKAKLLEATVDLLWTPEKLWFGPPQSHRNSSESAESHGLRGPKVMPGTLMVPTPWFRRLFAWNEIQDIHLSLSWGRNYAETVGCRFGRDQRWRNGAKSLCHLSSATTVRLGWEPPRNLGEMESCRPAVLDGWLLVDGPWSGSICIAGIAIFGTLGTLGRFAKNLLLGRLVAPIETWDQLSQGLTLTEKTEVSAASCSGFLADISWERFFVMFDELCPLSPLKGAVATWVEWGFQDAFQGWVPSVLRDSYSTWCGRVWSAN